MKEVSKEIRRQWIMTIIFVAFILAAVMIRGRSAGGRITVQVNNEAIGIAGETQGTVFVQMSEIENVEIIDVSEFDPGTKISGDQTANLYEGSFDNEKYGEYTAVIGPNSEQLIVVKTPGQTIVFTGLSDTDTEQIYENITSRL